MIGELLSIQNLSILLLLLVMLSKLRALSFPVNCHIIQDSVCIHIPDAIFPNWLLFKLINGRFYDSVSHSKSLNIKHHLYM